MTSLSVILRAEHHDDGAPFTAPRPRDTSPTRESTSTMTTPSTSPGDAQSQKRAVPVVEEEEETGGKRRARGRPRVEPKDDTAADVSLRSTRRRLLG